MGAEVAPAPVGDRLGIAGIDDAGSVSPRVTRMNREPEKK